jgi:hypothetical protein
MLANQRLLFYSSNKDKPVFSDVTHTEVLEEGSFATVKIVDYNSKKNTFVRCPRLFCQLRPTSHNFLLVYISPPQKIATRRRSATSKSATQTFSWTISAARAGMRRGGEGGSENRYYPWGRPFFHTFFPQCF